MTRGKASDGRVELLKVLRLQFYPPALQGYSTIIKSKCKLQHQPRQQDVQNQQQIEESKKDTERMKELADKLDMYC